MPRTLVTLLFLVFTISSFAQQISPADMKVLKKKEDSLKVLALKIIQGRNSSDRFIADSEFTRIFVRALKLSNSFNFPFDSLITISKLSAPDKSFRIFTWQMVINDYVVRQHGAIQIKTPDGSLKLFPLIDKSDVTEDMADTIGNNFGWMGAVYYKMIEKEAFGKKYYTFLGYDENSLKSNKKIIEVLTFNNGEPVFGGSYFSVPDNSVSKGFTSRVVMEYKKNAGPRLTYDTDQDLIIMEHMISETGEPQKKYTYIPDGDYEGLKWQDGKWVFIEKVYKQVTELGKEPVPNPIRDDKGNLDESKLKNNQEDNTDSTLNSIPIKPKPIIPKPKKKG